MALTRSPIRLPDRCHNQCIVLSQVYHRHSPPFISKVSAFMPRRLQDLVVFAAPGVFVVLWASGIIGAKLGLAYAGPLTFLALRMGIVMVLLGAISRSRGPNGRAPAVWRAAPSPA
jgi:hypothetical protein